MDTCTQPTRLPTSCGEMPAITITGVVSREPDEVMVWWPFCSTARPCRDARLEAAPVASVESPLHDLGLGVYLVRGSAAQLLTVDRPIERAKDIDEHSALKLLTDAKVHRSTSRLGSGAQTAFIGHCSTQPIASAYTLDALESSGASHAQDVIAQCWLSASVLESVSRHSGSGPLGKRQAPR
jgi:hypothetical protein